MVRMALERRVVHPLDKRMGIEKFHHFQGVLDVSLHAQTERFNSLQQYERIEWRERCAGIAQQDGPDTGHEGGSTHCFGKHDAVVRWVGSSQSGELAGLCRPVELASVDNHSA